MLDMRSVGYPQRQQSARLPIQNVWAEAECSHARTENRESKKAPIPLPCLREQVHRILQIGSRAASLFRSYASLPKFAREAKAHASVLPVVSRQLKDTVGAIESGTQAVCLNFREMASLAQSSASMGARLMEADGSHNVNEVIQDCRITMTQLLDRLEQSGQLYAKAIAQMELVDTRVQRVFETLKQLDQSSFASRLVALNAKIEAVHLGDLGSGFEVVADQISTQAHRSAELTASVAVILTDLTKTMKTATSELRQLADTDRDAAAHSRAGAEAALENLQFASSQMQETVAETRRVSETLYTEISNAVVAMQFQDRVSQRIGHVIDSLEAMNQALTSFESAEDISLAERKQQIAQSLASSYTMDSERRAHGSEIATVAVAEELAPEDTGDVELF